MTDTHADAVAALARAMGGGPHPHHTTLATAQAYLTAILADPAKRRALLTVLLDPDAVAAALRGAVSRTQTGDRTLLVTAAAIIAALTKEPSDDH